MRLIDVNNYVLLGSAIQLIKDIEHISFLGDGVTCVKIRGMAKDWLKQLDQTNCGAKMDGGAENENDS